MLHPELMQREGGWVGLARGDFVAGDRSNVAFVRAGRQADIPLGEASPVLVAL